jgi:hypothetical protein
MRRILVAARHDLMREQAETARHLAGLVATWQRAVDAEARR